MNITQEEVDYVEEACRLLASTDHPPIDTLALVTKLKRAVKHPQPYITADLIIWRHVVPSLARKPGDSSVEILLVQRAKPPFKNHWALPGGHFDIETDESIIDAGYRELKEETNISKSDLMCSVLEYFRYYDQKKRDTRGRYVDHVFEGMFTGDPAIVKAADDVKAHDWINVGQLDKLDLAFDHLRIINDWMENS